MLTNHNRSKNLEGGNSGDSDNLNHKIIQLAKDSCLNQQIIEELESLFQFSSPKELSRYLRDVFLFSLTDHNHILLQVCRERRIVFTLCLNSWIWQKMKWGRSRKSEDGQLNSLKQDEILSQKKRPVGYSNRSKNFFSGTRGSLKVEPDLLKI